MGIFSLLIPFEKNKFVFFSNFRGLHNCDAGVAIAIPENASGHCNCDAGIAIAAPTGLFYTVFFVEIY